jgi:ankyrin repeat protein
MLLDYGAKADAENDQGETPLHLVSRGKYDSQEDGVSIVRLLLERGVDVNARKKNKATPLHSVAFRGRIKVAEVLLFFKLIIMHIPITFWDRRCFSIMARTWTWGTTRVRPHCT